MAESDDVPPSSRRRAERHLACFPAQLVTNEGSTRTAIIHDLSRTGTLLRTRARLAVGEEVQLSLFLTGSKAEDARAVSGRVVRIERSIDGDPWPNRTAIDFDTPLEGCDAEIRELEEKQAAWNKR